MESKDKAIELVEQYKAYVHGYVGSSMLTNHEYPDQIVRQAKNAARVAANEVLSQCHKLNPDLINSRHKTELIVYWENVITHIKNITS